MRRPPGTGASIPSKEATMLLELDNDERQVLIDLLDARLEAIGPEERRSQTFHYKDLLKHEHEVLDRVRAKLRENAMRATTSAK